MVSTALLAASGFAAATGAFIVLSIVSHEFRTFVKHLPGLRYILRSYAFLLLLGRAQTIAAPLMALFGPKEFTATQIEDGIYLGNFYSSLQKPQHARHGVTHILCAILGVTALYPSEYTYMNVQVADEPDANIAQYFEAAHRFISVARSKNTSVLVHCRAGISRSATILASYYMKERGMSAEEAVQMLRSKRSIVLPNAGFMLQLRNYEKILRAPSPMEEQR